MGLSDILKQAMAGTPSATLEAGVDVINTSLTLVAPNEISLGDRLDSMLDTALKFFREHDPQFIFVPEQGLLYQLQRLMDEETRSLRRRDISTLISLMRNYFNRFDPATPERNAGQIRIYKSEDHMAAFATVVPPRGDGNLPTLNMLQSYLAEAGITEGLDELAMEQILKVVRDNRDLVWRALIARGKPADPEVWDRVELDVWRIDKSQLRRDPGRMTTALNPLAAPITIGQRLGRVYASQTAQTGRTVFGATIPPPARHVDVELGDGLTLQPDGDLIARKNGYLITEAKHLEIEPFYIITSPEPGNVNLAFNGTVLIQGTLKGPGTVDCDDLFVLGHCEQVKATVRGDVFISGGIIGHHATTVDADGGIYVSFVSEARLSALGEIMVSNAIINSQLTSNNRIHVTSPKGMIAGGTLMCLREIMAATIGSEFGMLTETVVGKDFLTAARMEEISRKLHLNEQNLARIEELKKTLARSRITLENLPPEKQEILIGILRKEEATLVELQSLLRRKKILEQGLKEFVSGSIQVLDSLYPPVKVQIGDAIREISERLNAVTLTYSRFQGIISKQTGSEGRGEGA